MSGGSKILDAQNTKQAPRYMEICLEQTGRPFLLHVQVSAVDEEGTRNVCVCVCVCTVP